jgi:hypothetical protein
MSGSTLLEQARLRAGFACEYCKMPDFLAVIDFELDHILADYHGGAATLENTAYACFACNRFKQSNIAGRNPATGRIVRLFNPRKDRWHTHFGWEGEELVGRTARGSVTIDVLRMNRPERLAMRASLIEARVLQVD